ncbi:MAG: hypothetical protein ACK58M_23265, partial [Acidobacteriota bacterium]
MAAVDDVEFGGGEPLPEDRFIGGFANGEDDALAVIAVFVVADLFNVGEAGEEGVEVGIEEPLGGELIGVAFGAEGDSDVAAFVYVGAGGG